MAQTSWAVRHPGYFRDWERAHRPSRKSARLLKDYGITLAQYDEMWTAQGGLCAACGQPSTRLHRQTGEVQRLSVDHDHITRRVRGLLCFACNLILGYADESPERLEGLSAYCRRFT